MLTERDFEPVLPSEMPVCDICQAGCLDNDIHHQAIPGTTDCDDINIGGLIFCDSCRKAEIARTLKEVTPPTLQQCTVTGDGIRIEVWADANTRQTWEFNGEKVEVDIKQDGNTWIVTPVDPDLTWDQIGVTLDYDVNPE
jgi:hypothetical protein